jgi:hypothetical protein
VVAATKEALANPPKYFRTPVSRGGQPQVDRTGGYRQAGLIRGVSVITRGEALGHDLWIDDTTLEQVETAINSQQLGIKSRFTHPGMSGDGLGKHVGRLMGAEVEGDQVFADQHFVQSAHKTPDGDLAEYLMTLAEEDPTSYGLSISFDHDPAAMDQFTTENLDTTGRFKSPDPSNLNNYPHVRIASLHAADAVDEPAANPNGLFHREKDVAREANLMASYALGLSNERPATVQLGLDADRVRGFVTRFLSNNKLELKPMAEDAVTETEEKPAEVVATETSAEEPTAPTTAETQPVQTAMSAQAEAARYLASFGKQGPVWLAEGLSFEQARDQQVTELQREIETLKQKLSVHRADGEDEPVSFNASDVTKTSLYASRISTR